MGHLLDVLEEGLCGSEEGLEVGAPFNVVAVETVSADVVRDVHGIVGACERRPIVSEVAHTAAFVASDSAGAMTGTVVSLSAGFSTD